MNSSTFSMRYITGVILAAAVLLGGFTMLAMHARADVNTGNPTVSGVTVTPTDTGATITWSSDQAGSTQVLYGLTSTYDASSTLNTTSLNSHTAFLGGLTPNTIYHYQVVTASSTTGLMGTSSDATFTTASSTVLASTTPVISSINATPSESGAVIVWNTDLAANSQVRFGTTNLYGNTTTLDTNSVNNHSVSLTGLMPNTLYHYQIWSAGTDQWASSSDMMFTTLMASTTATTTDTAGLQTQIDALKARVAALEAALAAWMGGAGGTGSTTPPTHTGSGTLDQTSMTVNAGGALNFGGRGFPREENITITLNGATVGTAHADGGGNFSTGSISAPTTAGTYTYVFTGSTGDVSSATVTVQ